MIRGLARAALLVMLALSAAGLWQGLRGLSDGPLRPLVARSAAEIRARAAAELALSATPQAVQARLRALLSETPHNWLAIDAVLGVARDRHIALPAPLEDRIAAARQEDTGLLATAAHCAACAYDAANCDFSIALICQAPMVLTPAGDIAGLVTEGRNYLADRPVDRVNLGLSLVGLGATGAALVTAGGTGPVALGANAARMAHRMRLLSPGVLRLMRRSVAEGIDWSALAAMRRDGAAALLTPSGWRRAIRPAAFHPAAALASDLGRVERAVGPRTTLHLLRYVRDGRDARRLARVSTALGPRTAGTVEMLGPARALRLAARWSRRLVALVSGLAGALAALTGLFGHAASHLTLRLLRRLAGRAPSGPRLPKPPRGYPDIPPFRPPQRRWRGI